MTLTTRRLIILIGVGILVRNLVLYPSRFSQELLRLLGDGVEPGRTSRDDLGLQVHWEGLVNMTRERAEYTLDHVRQAFEESKTVRAAI